MQRIYSQTVLFRNRRAIKRRELRQRLWKSLNAVIVMMVVVNVSMVGSLLYPKTTLAVTTNGTITVQKQFDTNGDGVVDIDGSVPDQILEGWDFSATGSVGDPLPTITQTTDTTGKASLSVIDDPAYTLSETTYPTGFHLDRASCTNGAGVPVGTLDLADLAVTGIPVNNDTINCVFINSIDTATINGQKWNDLNGNGSWDEAAPAQIGDWQIFLDTNNNGILDVGEQATTTSNVVGPDFGWYHFTDLPYGTYRVCETSQIGWGQTFPGTPNGCHTVSILDPQNGDTCTPAAPEDPYNLVCDFGNQHQAAITVLKNVDTNGDGDVTDEGDIIGATDWTWDLNGGNQNFATGLTKYATPGTTITVKEDQKAGFHFTGVNCTDDNGSLQVIQDEQVSFPVAVGGLYTCTYTNTKNTSTTIDKQGPTTTTAGTNATYTINWTVTGAPDATNVTITDPLPAHTTFVSADNDGVLDNNTVRWNLGTKAPGTSGTVSVTLRVDSPLPNNTAITNIATLDTDQTEPTTDSATTTVLSAPSLSISKSNSVTTFVNPGASVNYTIVVTNAADASDSANTVTLTDILPNGFTYSDGGGSTKTFALGTIAPGASVTTTYTISIGSSQAAGTYTNTAKAKGENSTEVTATSKVEVRVPEVPVVTPPPTPAPVSPPTPTPAPTPVPTTSVPKTAPHLTLIKTVDLAIANPGDTVTYTLVVKNTGTVTASNVVIKDNLPAAFSFADDGTNNKTWTFATLVAGASQTVTARVKVGNAMAAGNYLNQASVSATDVDPVVATVVVRIAVPEVKGVDTTLDSTTASISSPQVESLAATGVSDLDYIIFSFGILLFSFGSLGLGYLRRNQSQVGKE